jgi:kinesin family protein 1
MSIESNNMINIDTSSRVLTAVRIRPLSTSEKLKNYQIIVSVNPENKGSLNILDPAIFKKNIENKLDIDKKMYERNFKYDHSFWSASDFYYFASQLDVYKACGEPLVAHCLAGLNCCILAFGQTGTGKVIYL